MSKINIALFLAHRISARNGAAKGVMVRMATVSVAVGVAVMIVALAVIGGFRNEITEKLTGFGADIKILGQGAGSAYEAAPVVWSEALAEEIAAMDGVVSIVPYATKSGIIRTPQAIGGVVLKGVDRGSNLSAFEGWLEEGAMPDVESQSRDLLISRLTADMLGFAVGDKVETMFIGNGNSVRRDLYKVCGIYSSGMDDFDRVTTVTGIGNLRRLNRWDDMQATGYEIAIADFDRLDEVMEQVETAVRHYNAVVPDEDMLYAVSIRQEYMGVFDWLATLDVNGTVIIVIMLAVALLNMISALLIILLERTSMIGVLKALGMTNGQLQRMFLARAGGIIVRGLVWGNVVGIGIALLQKYTGLITLDSSGYLLSQVPVQFDWAWWIGLNLGVPVVLLLLLTLPVMVVGAIRPEQTMRYQ